MNDTNLESNRVIYPRLTNKTILDVSPFNDIFYKGCFFNSLFTLFLYYGIDIYKYLINDAIYYKYHRDTGLISTEYLEAIPICDSFKEDQIQFYTEKCCKDILESVITSIDNGRPTIVICDPYYNSVRQDVYKKKHLNHSILINGYDRTHQIIHAVEHRQWENLNYEHLRIPFKDMNESYYNEVNQDNLLPFTYFDIVQNSPKILAHSILKTRYHNLTVAYITVLLEGLHSLNCFIDNYSMVSLQPDELKRKSDAYLNSFNQIINSKQVEKYRIYYLFGYSSNPFKSIDTIISSWGKVRAFLAKYYFSDFYDINNFLRSKFELEKILIEEEKFIKEIII